MKIVSIKLGQDWRTVLYTAELISSHACFYPLLAILINTVGIELDELFPIDPHHVVVQAYETLGSSFDLILDILQARKALDVPNSQLIAFVDGEVKGRLPNEFRVYYWSHMSAKLSQEDLTDLGLRSPNVSCHFISCRDQVAAKERAIRELFNPFLMVSFYNPNDAPFK